MIFYWLRKLAEKIAWLFKPAQARDVARIRTDSPCPVCGARSNILRCVRMAAASGTNGHQTPVIMCEHTCTVDGARWYEQPVAKIGVSNVFPAIARNELERAADKAWERGLNNVIQ